MTHSSSIRERIERREEDLSSYAARSRASQGRLISETPCPLRSTFQRDRDRIIHSKAFRRLKHKTQVFIAPLGDHYVTRLTHTLEVSQIARSIARALNLNEDLTEAIALGHDLGHTPFGHTGEEVLDKLFPEGFKHHEQSLRVVDILERSGQGLNLTWEVRDGILHHSKGTAKILGQGWGGVATLEGEICKVADTTAYINHDTSDAIRAGIISENDLPAIVTDALGPNPSARINTVVSDIVESSWAATGLIDNNDKPAILMSPKVREAIDTLRQFLFQQVYNPLIDQDDSRKAIHVIGTLFEHFVAHQERLPQEFTIRTESPERRATDYIAGMTDLYALRLVDQVEASHPRLIQRQKAHPS